MGRRRCSRTVENTAGASMSTSTFRGGKEEGGQIAVIRKRAGRGNDEEGTGEIRWAQSLET